MEFVLPHIGEGVHEAELVRWLVAVGDGVQPGQPLAELLTDKATMEVPAPFAGTITALLAGAGATLPIGAPLLTYTPTAEAAPATAAVAVPAARESHAADDADGPNGTAPAPTPLSVKASPSVRLMARKLGIDLTRMQGSGPEGRILIDDLGAAVRPVAPGRDMPPPRPEPRFDYGTPGSQVPLSGLRRKIAERMVRSKQSIPHYSYIDECDVSDLVRLRTALKEPFGRGGLKLSYLPFFVKAVTAALREVPIVNARLDEDGKVIHLHDRYHIGIAVATPQGLLVPVIRDADRKDVATLAREIDRLSADARAGKARLEDLRGGTFTITSVGNIGGLISTPVINPPEVGILGIGKVVRRPVYDDAGAIRPADLVYLSFSFDHRVVDGAVGAVFGNAVIARLRNPAALLLPEAW